MSAPISNAKIHDLVTQRLGQAPTPSATAAQKADSGPAFEAILENRLKLSGHAKSRLSSREIELGKAEWDRVMSGVEKAAQKGARESLVLLDDVALLVSIKNRTIITAVDKANLKENVFTNIDSAVLV